ncbi:MAG TPA: hypothetical protein P5108_00265 [Marmoricola sp.]|nr:hypothetical protein [Nocardioidaceae bacterium]HRV67862.1 hypothetical protein [Marmoricola sp.]
MTDYSPGNSLGQRLVLMRHAQAESFASPDSSRGLTDQGSLCAEDVGQWLTGQDLIPDFALVSPAIRTRSSWGHLAKWLPHVARAQFDKQLYTGGVDESIEALRAATPQARVVLYLGHNPIVSATALSISRSDDRSHFHTELAMGMPPAGVAVLDYAGPWSEIGPDSANLINFYVGNPG